MVKIHVKPKQPQQKQQKEQTKQLPFALVSSDYD